jgi:hypothetical protein
VSVTFTPREGDGAGVRLALERRLRFEPGRIVLVTYDGRALSVRER